MFMVISGLTIVLNTSNHIKSQSMPLGRGVLVAVEGIDRAGKSTQIQRLDRY